ncbi:MAG: DUF4249 family protein [Cyclobacteriaceae bacterium]
MINNLVAVSSLLLLCFGCISEFETDFADAPIRLVIEGNINTEPGPYQVRVTHTHRFDFSANHLQDSIVSGLQLSIADDLGNEEFLHEIGSGVYTTATDGSGMTGKVGRTYILTIISNEGTIYKSTPQKIQPVAPVSRVEVEKRSGRIPTPDGLRPSVFSFPINPAINRLAWFGNLLTNPEELAVIPEELIGEPAYLIRQIPYTTEPIQDIFPESAGNTFDAPNSHYTISIETNDTPGETNFYMWTIRVHFLVTSYPEYYTIRGFKNQTISFINIPKSCCSECYATYTAPVFSIGSDRLVDGNTICSVVGAIPFNNFIFQNVAYIEVMQHSLNHVAFNNLNEIKRQQNDVGGLFDRSPALLISNIYNVDDPDDLALGYFWASDVKSKGSLVYDGGFNQEFIISNDCRTLNTDFLKISTTKPDSWSN